MAIKRKLNLGFGTNLEAVNLSALPPHAVGQLNGVIESGLNGYQLVKLVDAGPSVANEIGYLKTSTLTPLAGQCTRTIGNSAGSIAYGVFTTAVTLNYYTLVKQRGAQYVKSTAGQLASAGLGVTATLGGAANDASTAGATTPTIGISMEALAATLAGHTMCYLTIPSF